MIGSLKIKKKINPKNVIKSKIIIIVGKIKFFVIAFISPRLSLIIFELSLFKWNKNGFKYISLKYS